jgi:hypothetical protein
MKRYSLLSAFFGAVSGVAGVLFWELLDFGLPFPGPIVVFVGIIIFAGTVIANWRLKITN